MEQLFLQLKKLTYQTQIKIIFLMISEGFRTVMIRQGNLYTWGRGWYRMCSCQSTVELAVAYLKNIFRDSKSAKPIVG